MILLLSNVNLLQIFSNFLLFSGFSDLIFLHNFSLPNYYFSHACILFYAEMHMFIYVHDLFIH